MNGKESKREPSRIACWIFEQSMIVYPDGFRNEFRDEITADFREILADSDRHPLVDTVREVLAVIFSAPEAWWVDEIQPRIAEVRKIIKK